MSKSSFIIVSMRNKEFILVLLFILSLDKQMQTYFCLPLLFCIYVVYTYICTCIICFCLSFESSLLNVACLQMVFVYMIFIDPTFTDVIWNLTFILSDISTGKNLL